jgi:hypothetical protein
VEWSRVLRIRRRSDRQSARHRPCTIVNVYVSLTVISFERSITDCQAMQLNRLCEQTSDRWTNRRSDRSARLFAQLNTALLTIPCRHRLSPSHGLPFIFLLRLPCRPPLTILSFCLSPLSLHSAFSFRTYSVGPIYRPSFERITGSSIMQMVCPQV